MPLDSLTIKGLVSELNDVLRGCRADKVFQRSKASFCFAVKPYGMSNSRLNISLGSKPRIYLSREHAEASENISPFCLLLRKHLAGARFVQISQPGLERAVHITFEGRNDFAEKAEKTLVAELMGSNSNLLLLDGTRHIIGCAKTADIEANDKRRVLPGLIYREPPVPDEKISVDRITKQQFADMIKNAEHGVPADKWLLSAFYGLSPVVCREVCFRAFGQTEVPFEPSDDAFCKKLADAFEMLMLYVEKPVPHLLCGNSGRPSDFSFMPVRQYEPQISCRSAESFVSASAAVYDLENREASLNTSKKELLPKVCTLRNRLQKKLGEQKKEIETARNRERLRIFADILMANPMTETKGADSVRLPNIYDENQAEIVIKTDRRLNVYDNASRYYREYAKKKNAESFLANEIEKGEQRLFYLESVIDAITRADDTKILSQIREELSNEHIISGGGKKSGLKAGKNTQPVLKKYISPNGFTILVGRNNRENEFITLKYSKKNDMWFHVKNYPGAHVVLEIPYNAELPESADIMTAASLAVKNSGISDVKNAAVDYTHIRNVKKIRDGGAGMVSYTDYKTVFADCDAVNAKEIT